MASILDRFYEINADGTPGKPVLFLDTLKVSTIEQTAEQVDARGGKGNPKLITWDYGKEITVNIEDALFSPKSMAIMFGDGGVTHASAQDIKHTAVVRITKQGFLPDYFIADVYDSNQGSARKKIYIGAGQTPAGMVSLANSGIQFFTGAQMIKDDGTVIDSALDSSDIMTAVSSWPAGWPSVAAGDKVMFTYAVKATTNTITISGDSFPGTYYVTGDTYARSDVDGRDQFFQFIIPKAKMSAENTITLEAEGDPSTFNMNLTVLRPESGDMMKLVQYELEGSAG